ncbi:dTDP-4-dehydrorhamnose reductase [Francisella sp. 19X1-34]|uniref:dTDP-4-dehydrorhamnose reductase n=1 Tax=Francisella sp. 19X1-34 TaxID=3087177 RepID=UPI002E301602|nr:dTDP-4-dehydrorhamnose reductase [Francisella sp. 19X1-34]MED7787570.1 dTDP-4-dehydrorhamnose reductase [Francisella sp. 19X1-34]
MRILVTGSSGQLGSELRELVCVGENVSNKVANDNGFEYFFTNSNLLNITSHDAVKQFIVDNNIDAIINCAAYTAVDKAESNFEIADKINNLAVANIAKIAKDLGLRLIHISTDYVFDGQNYRPYCESDETNPQGVYGITKLAGEKAVLKINPKNSIIIRTSWVYSYYGNNFVKTMLRLGKERELLGVIYDQVGAPTYAKDLAKSILAILTKLNNQGVEVYNYSNEGVTSWYDFAKEIMSVADINCQVNPIVTADYPTPAKRPHYSVLNKNKVKRDFDIVIPYWRDSLKDCIRKLQKDL